MYFIISNDNNFHRTEIEKELSFSFSYQHKVEIAHLENLVHSEANKIRRLRDATDKIEQCEKAIETFEKMRSFCYMKGNAGKLYFNDMWEHCHNSNNDCFSYIQPIKKILKGLQANE